jgi:hypothetical protein
MGRSQRHRVEEQVRSSSGHIYEQGAINDQALKAIGGAITGAMPVLTSLNPATAAKGSADLTLHCLGSGFTANSVINFNGGNEPTTFVNAGDITTIVKPSLVSIAIAVPVVVVNGVLSSAPKTFTFT